jgi:hypothetical protein
MHGTFAVSKGCMPSPLGRESEFFSVKQVWFPQKQNHRQWLVFADSLPPHWNEFS